MAIEVAAQLFVFTRPVARPFLQQVNEHVASGKAPVKGVNGLQRRALITRWRRNSVLRADTDALPDLAQLGRRELGEFFHETFGGRSHGGNLRRSQARVELPDAFPETDFIMKAIQHNEQGNP